MRILLLVVAALGLARGVGRAQGSPNVCGTLRNPANHLEWLAPYFVDEDYADFRNTLKMQAVPADALQTVVHDARVCGRLHPLVMEKLRARRDWRDLQQHGFDYAVLRYGSYYAVIVREVKPAGVTISEFSDLMIFRATDLQYVGGALV